MTTIIATHCCVYINCKKKENIDKEISFFKFPVSREDILNKWIEYSGNIDLISLTKDQLSKRKICELHFKPEFVMGGSGTGRKNLVKHAVPYSIKENTAQRDVSPDYKLKHPIKRTYDKNKLTSESEVIEESSNLKEVHYLTPPKRIRYSDYNSSPSSVVQPEIIEIIPPPLKESPGKLKMRLKLKNQSRIIKAKRVQNLRLKRKLNDKTNTLNKIIEKKPKNVKTFINMQIKHKPRTQWTEDEKQLALSYYYKSPSLYKYMRMKSKMILPSPRTIRKWLQFFHLPTGVETVLFKNLSLKVKVMEAAERQCIIIFDEMSIKKFLQLDMVQDLVEGFEDLGSLGRTSRIANHATVFMVRSLMHNWRIPISYYFHHDAMKSDNLTTIVRENISKCLSIGLNVRCIISDQCSNNRATFNKLGVSKLQPHFELESRKIYAIFDTPHLLKSLRNTLLSSDIFMDGKRVSWNDIREVHRIDSKSLKTRILVKITEKHIMPNKFEKMSVKLATQIFSRTMAAALDTGIQTKVLNSDSAKNTVIFVRKINDLFDCLNSRVLNDSNPYRCGLSDKNMLVKDTLQDALEFLNSCKLYNKEWKERQNIYCLNGMVQTINGILSLFEDIKEENYKFLLTNRLQQDALENQFSIIRNRGGYNANPTARQFRQALQQCMHIQILDTIGTGNCEIDDSEMLNISLSQSNEVNSDNCAPDNTCDIGNDNNTHNVEENVEDDFSISDSEQDINAEKISEEIQFSKLEECAFVYFVGYLAHQCMKEFECEHCKVELQKNKEILADKNEILLVLKDYGNNNDIQYLVRPSESLLTIMTELLNIFQNYYILNIHKSNFTKKLRECILQHIFKNHSNWLTESDICYDHKIFIINKLIKVKTHKTLMWDSNRLKNTESYKRKVNILQNK